MLLFQYEPEVSTTLRECGWSVDRRVDTRPFEIEAAQLGIHTVERALEFLRQYADLEVQYRGIVKTEEVDVDFGFSLALPTKNFEIEFHIQICRGIAAIVGHPIMRVGYNCGGQTELFMDEFGNMYEYAEPHIYLAGVCGEEAIQRYILGQDHIREVYATPFR